MLSIFINFVYIHDQKLNKNKLGNVGNTLLIILQKIRLFLSYALFNEFQFEIWKF